MLRPVKVTLNTRMHSQAAKLAPALPYWYSLVETSRFGDASALAVRPMS
jgi:hypothetical protein